jgi:hypothetical protein
MTIGVRGAALLAASLVTATLVGCANTTTLPSTHASSTNPLPPLLEYLERKMEGLRVDSERYSKTVTARTGSQQDPKTFGGSEIGEVDISKAEDEDFTASSHTPIGITIGPTYYSYAPQLASDGSGHSWVRRKAAATQPSFPYHGLPTERATTGKGPYTGLINLINTATRNITVGGQTSIGGHRATVFTALVDPAPLLRRIHDRQLRTHAASNEDIVIEQTHLRSLPTKLEVFITETGLPIRIHTSARHGLYATSETIEILAINTPVRIARPSPRQTISEAEFARLYQNGKTGRIDPRPIEG